MFEQPKKKLWHSKKQAPQTGERVWTDEKGEKKIVTYVGIAPPPLPDVVCLGVAGKWVGWHKKPLGW